MIAYNFAGGFGVLSGGEKEKMEDEKQGDDRRQFCRKLWGVKWWEKEKMEDEKQGNDRRQFCRGLWGEQMMGERKEWRMLIKVMVYLVQTGVFW